MRPGVQGAPAAFHLLLQLIQINFDQLPQLLERCFEVRRGRRVLIHVRLRRPRVDIRCEPTISPTRSPIEGGRFMLR